MKQNLRTGSQSAFTLIEVIAVLVLVGILATVVAGSLRQSSAPVVLAADQLASNLRYVQSRALADVEAWEWVAVGGNVYLLQRVGGEAVWVPGSDANQVELAGGLSISGPSLLRFDPWGRPINTSGGLLTEMVTFTVTEGTNSATVEVLPETGLVRR